LTPQIAPGDHKAANEKKDMNGNRAGIRAPPQDDKQIGRTLTTSHGASVTVNNQRRRQESEQEKIVSFAFETAG